MCSTGVGWQSSSTLWFVQCTCTNYLGEISMQGLTKAQLAAALVATFGFCMHGSAMAAPSNGMGAVEKQSPTMLADESSDKAADKSKDASCKGKEGSCKG